MFIGSDDGTEEAWTFSLAHPPAMLMRNTVAAPERPIGAARDSIRFPGVFWLPFAVLVEGVHFRAFKAREPSCGRRPNRVPSTTSCRIAGSPRLNRIAKAARPASSHGALRGGL